MLFCPDPTGHHVAPASAHRPVAEQVLENLALVPTGVSLPGTAGKWLVFADGHDSGRIFGPRFERRGKIIARYCSFVSSVTDRLEDQCQAVRSQGRLEFDDQVSHFVVQF